ncbi:sigma-70 family RNA polymerase sigma factor [Microbispora hainanensis]|uniref:sigma-70 family RNA polymerase sigma factor n=1 Tax=Microbispora hainanensis TaxID=568844 RepID=UPI002E2E5788|nr:sigma-70 family RNA polymerase sigma factor [Microbispora hainanensis]
MPEWPGVGRADDHRLLEALRRGGGADAQATAALYDAYADRLSDYAYELVRDLDTAERAVHDALVAASCCAGRLKEPARLRAWLYALTRFHSATRSTRKGAAQVTGPVMEMTESADPPLAALVREALGEIADHEREVLQLAVRHGLTAAEVGSVLGLSSRQVSARLTRARDHLENAAAALVLARVGRAHCPELSALVDHGVGAAWQDGPLAAPLRKRLSKHIAGCEICREGRGRHVSAGRLLDMIPVAFPPLSLRRRVIESALHADRRDDVATAAFDQRGFPATTGRRAEHRRTEPAHTAHSRTGHPQTEHPQTGHPQTGHPQTGHARTEPGRNERRRVRSRPLRTAPVMFAAVCVFGAAGGLALVSGQAPAERLEAIRVSPTAAPQDPGQPEEPEASEEPVLGREGNGPPEATPAAPGDETPPPNDSPQSAATAPPHTAPSGRSRPSSPSTRRTPEPALTALCPGDLGTATGASITLAARNAVIEWTAVASGGITVSPRHGRLRAGASGRVTLSVVDPGVAGKGIVTFTSSAGRPSCRMTWDGREGNGDTDPLPDRSSEPTTAPTRPTRPPGGGSSSQPPDEPGESGGSGETGDGPSAAGEAAATPST